MRKSIIGAAIVSCALAFTLSVQAQDGGQKKGEKKKGGGEHSMTGCLAKGTEAKVPWMLTNVEGGKFKSVEILETASGVDLAPHVGHKITITGTAISAKEAAAKEGEKKGKKKEEAAEHHMKVDAVKMVSATCP